MQFSQHRSSASQILKGKLLERMRTGRIRVHAIVTAGTLESPAPATLRCRPPIRPGIIHVDVALDTTDQHGAFRRALTDRGIRGALALLNDRTSYRFTAIYKLVGSVLRAQYAYDRSSEYRTWLMVVPLERSFCQYAIESGEFMTSGVSKDPRLANRPYAGMVEAYYGQLLRRPDGTPYGTFIHFDLESRSIAADEIDFLRETVPLLMKQLA